MTHDFAAKKMRMSRSGDDSLYFDSYADIAVHEEMLSDEVRTNAYKNAIYALADRIKNKVVLDVGAGTGILSVFCAKAGAKKVYAVEASNIAQQAKKVVKLNGVESQVEVIQEVLEEVTLPEKVDIIVSEWMGYCLLYESMLSSVIVARDRWLKKGGLIVPEIAAVYCSPVSDDEIINEKVNFWKDMNECYGVDMSCLTEFARRSFSKEVMVKQVNVENILSHPQRFCTIDLYVVELEHLQRVRNQLTFRSFGSATLQGIALWFDTVFPTCNSSGFKTSDEPKQNNIYSNSVAKNIQQTIVLSTSPYQAETHWKQSILYLKRGIDIEQDSRIKCDILLSPNSTNTRFLDIEFKCSVSGNNKNDNGFQDNGESWSVQKYLMGYETPADRKALSSAIND